MRDLTIPDSGAKRKLLDAAERLFAEKGFDCVAVRDVSQAVGMNVASVNYYFGSRANLLATVILHYALPLQKDRLAHLEKAVRKAGGGRIQIEEILAAYIKPLRANFALKENSETSFYQLVGRIFTDHGNSLFPQEKQIFSEVNERFIQALSKLLPEVSIVNLEERFHFIQGAMIHLLTHHSLLVKNGKPHPTMEESLERLISFAVLGLCGGEVSESFAEEPEEDSPQAVFNF